MLVAKSVRFGDVAARRRHAVLDRSRGRKKQGRYVIVRRTADGKIEDVLPAPFSARTTGPRIRRRRACWRPTASSISRITPTSASGDSRPGEAAAADHGRRQAAVRRFRARRASAIGSSPSAKITRTNDHEPANRIVAVSLADGKVTPLVEGRRFLFQPARQSRWPPTRVARVESSEHAVGRHRAVRRADSTADGSLGKPRKVAGGNDESIFQPSWSPDGTLYFVSDRTQLVESVRRARRQSRRPILPMDAEFGAPQWVFGMTTYGFHADGTIIARYTRGGKWSVVRIDPQSGKHETIKLPYSNVSSIDVAGNRVYALAGSPTEPESLIEIDLATGKIASDPPQLADRSPTRLTRRFPRRSSFRPTAARRPTRSTIRPRTATSAARRAKRRRSWCSFTAARPPPPPPSSACSTQFWTSRGFAVCDVNYGGSTGYGREYRNRLRDTWGVVDVADAANAALYLADQGKADRTKLIIRGGSAGGYTTLACLTFSDVVPLRRELTTASATSPSWSTTRTNSSRATSTASSARIRKTKPAIASARRSFISTGSTGR